jgi:cell wall assembly regulator SMI1
VKSWQRIERWLAEHLPDVVLDLRPPASAEEIRAAEKILGALPDEVRELYRIHDGQEGETTGAIFGLPLLPIHQVVGEWRSWIEIIDPGTNEELSESCTSDPEDAIQCFYTCRGWIPLSHDHGGNHFGVDLAPGPRGESGQVINFGRDENDKHVLASSLDDFLLKIGDLLDEGNFVIDADELTLKNPPVKHLLDAASFIAGRSVRRIH